MALPEAADGFGVGTGPGYATMAGRLGMEA